LQWIELYSLSGELLKKVPLGGNSEAIVSLDEAKAGVYVAKIQANSTTFVRKVLVR
jgi:putative thiol protease/hemagglutinin prtT